MEVTGSKLRLSQYFFFPRIDDNHSDRIHSSLTPVSKIVTSVWEAVSGLERKLCKVLVKKKKKKLQVSMDMCTGHRDITEIICITALNTTQATNRLFFRVVTPY